MFWIKKKKEAEEKNQENEPTKKPKRKTINLEANDTPLERALKVCAIFSLDEEGEVTVIDYQGLCLKMVQVFEVYEKFDRERFVEEAKKSDSFLSYLEIRRIVEEKLKEEAEGELLTPPFDTSGYAILDDGVSRTYKKKGEV